MWTKTLKTCLAAIGLLTAVTLAGCVVNGEREREHETVEIQSTLSFCGGFNQRQCFEHRDRCVAIWRLPDDCQNAELCDFEFVLCADLAH